MEIPPISLLNQADAIATFLLMTLGGDHAEGKLSRTPLFPVYRFFASFLIFALKSPSNSFKISSAENTPSKTPANVSILGRTGTLPKKLSFESK